MSAISSVSDRANWFVILIRAPFTALPSASRMFVLLLVTARPALISAEPAQPAPTSNTQEASSAKPPATDSLGDPLPEGAKLRLGTLRFQPPSNVSEIALSPDEQTIVTVGKELIAWDAVTGKERWRVNAREHGLDSNASYGMRLLAFSADSSKFYTPMRPNTILVWNVMSGGHDVITVQSGNQLGQQRSCQALDVTADGQTLVLGDANGVTVCGSDGQALYEIANIPNKEIKSKDRLTFGGEYSFVRFSPDGKTLAVVKSDTSTVLRLHDAQGGQELRQIALQSQLVRLAFSPDGKHIATTEREAAIRLYEVESGKEVWSMVLPLKNPYENYTSAIAFSPDGKIVAAAATDYHIYLIDAVRGTELAALAGHTWYPWAVAFTGDSKTLYSSGWDGPIRRWDVEARKQMPLPQGIRATGSIAASSDGRTLAYEDDLGTIRLVDARNGVERRTLELPGSRYSPLTFSLDGRLLAGGGTNGDNVHVAVWDLASGAVLWRWDWPKGADPHSTVESLCFSPNGTRLAAAVFRQSAARIWDLTSGQSITQLEHKSIYGLSFSPNSETLATAGWDSTIRFWETDTGEIRGELDLKDGQPNVGDLRMYVVRYAPEGDLIATAHLDGTVRVWQADNMALRKAFKIDGRFIYGAIRFSPDGLWLATGSMGGQVALWDPISGQKVWDVGRHQGYVGTVGFGRDSQTMLSGGADGVCYLWDLRPSAKPIEKDLASIWDDLAGVDGPAAYDAMWALANMPERAVSLISEKLRVVTIVDPDRADEGATVEEVQRRKRLSKRLGNKEPLVVRAVTARRALALLAQLGTPDSIRLLKDLVTQDPKGELGRLAAAALDRLSTAEQP